MAVRLQGRVSAQEPGAAVRYLARHGGQTSRAPVWGQTPCAKMAVQYLALTQGVWPRFPRRTFEAKGVRIAAKPISDTPHGMVARPAKRRAAVGGGRAGRSSPPTGSWSWPPGASLDALPLLPIPSGGPAAARLPALAAHASAMPRDEEE
jgi:hypothetical protein